MKVRVKLMGTLRDRLPAEARGQADVELPAGATLQALLDQVGAGGSHVHAVMVNDGMETDRQRLLAEGDSVVVIPPVAGG
jgi:molybdopterin converting factor small subunit